MWKILVLALVRKWIKHIPDMIRATMRTKKAKTLCVVVGGALGAYGASQCDGAEAIAGVVIGVGMVAWTAIPFDKLIKYIPVSKVLGWFIRSKVNKDSKDVKDLEDK